MSTLAYTATQFYAAIALAVFVGTAFGIFLLAALTMSSRSDRDEMGVQASQMERHTRTLTNGIWTEFHDYELEKMNVGKDDWQTRARLAEGTLARVCDIADKMEVRFQN